MAGADVLLILGIVGSAFLAALGGLGLTTVLSARSRRGAGPLAASDEGAVFLFADDQVLDATPQARQILSATPNEGSDWSRLLQLLTPRLPDLAQARDRALSGGRTTLLSTDGTTRVVLSVRDDVLRVSLAHVETSEATLQVDRLSLAAAQQEMETLRAISEGVPWLVWREDRVQPSGKGQINWANSAYLDCVAAINGQTETWPPPHIFDTDAGHDGFGEPRRLALLGSARAPTDWYTVSAQALADGVIYTAVSAAREVAADAALGAFRQTLTQTFASLDSGLAIFDQDRALTLFNPALAEILSIPVEFVITKPSLFTFLDRLREDRRMPEPRNYKEWRENLTELEGGASGHGYAATWTLADGQVLDVKGRPHGNGAFALIFKDITHEIALTRQFRAELDLSQAVLDSLDEALVIFDNARVLTLSNAAYAAMWGVDPRSSLGDMTLSDAMQRWNARTAATPAWKQLRTFAHAREDRAPWTDTLRMMDGRALSMRAAPLSGGATLVGFRIGTVRAPKVAGVTRLDRRAAGASG